MTPLVHRENVSEWAQATLTEAEVRDRLFFEAAFRQKGGVRCLVDEP